MAKLSIKRFGPIDIGCKENDGFIDIKQCSVFIGPQGSGKSCVVKLISLFSWLEKGLVSGNLKTQIKSNSFVEETFDYHGIAGYLDKKTELEYRGDAYSFSYKEGKLKGSRINASYVRPKILYIPADRSFCTSIKNPGKITGLPENTFDFLLDFTDAELGLKKKLFHIPINGYSFSYDNESKQAYLLDEKKGYRIDITSASSGILSALPMVLTTAYYSGFLSVRPMKQSLDQLNEMYNETIKKIEKIKSSIYEMEKVDLNAPVPELKKKTRELKNLGKTITGLLNSVHNPDTILSEVINSRLINIVEEPEQNLFPESQADILYYLLRCMNSGSVLGGNNSLVITTHSPYVIEALNNSIYAKRLVDSGKKIEGLLKEDELISFDNVAAYKLSDGIIENIKDNELKQIDSEYLDSCSARIRKMYSRLEDIEFSNE